MKKLLGSALGLAMLVALSEDAHSQSVSFEPQFNYVEAGLTDDVQMRNRAFNTNRLVADEFYVEHNAFTEQYGTQGILSRNAINFGIPGSVINPSIVQTWVGEFDDIQRLDTQAGINIQLLDTPLGQKGIYGFFDAGDEISTVVQGKKFDPSYTLFAGKDVGDTSLWLYATGDMGKIRSSFAELQLNKNFNRGVSLGARIELYEANRGLEKDNAVYSVNIGKTF